MDKLNEKINSFLARAREKMSYEIINEEMVKRLEDGGKVIGPYVDFYEGKKFEYYDKYYTGKMEDFLGKESILIDGKEKWFRNYDGYFVDKNFVEKAYEVFEFLKKAMKGFPKEKAFRRGKIELNEGNYKYEDKCEGNIAKFEGKEKIYYNEKEIYSLNYLGGIKEE
jgi:hypothetical protein